MSPTLEEIGQLAGVSRSTVSRVVNDHPHVRDDVRQRVWQVIRETGYQPHAAARSLVTRRTRIIGVIIPEAVSAILTTPFFISLLCGITDTCNIREYHLMLSLFSAPAGQEKMYRRVVRSGNLDGVLVASARTGDPVIHNLLEDGFPFVMVGRHPDPRVPCVDIDNVSAAEMAVRHLLCLGHRRIATITGPLDAVSAQDRLEGYRRALKARNIPVEEALIYEGDYAEESGRMGAWRLLSASPTALFAASDSMAVGVLKALREAGLRVPQDVALVGFDDVSVAAAVEPALTTVRQPIEELGATASELLLNLLEDPPDKGAYAQQIVLPTKLIVRDSCGALS